MTEQGQIKLEKEVKVPHPKMEGRYNYLADFCKEQSSPNLRKEYEQQYEKCSNSINGATQLQEMRPSRNYNHYHRGRNYSPSCSTFNPKRELSHQFSPYEQQMEDPKDQVVSQELLNQNASLKIKLSQALQSVQKLNGDLISKNSQFAKWREKSQSDLAYYERIVGEMKNEIKIAISKNKMLEDELFVVRTRFQEESRRISQKSYERAPLSSLSGFGKQNEKINMVKGKRSVGKLFNKSVNLRINDQNSKPNFRIMIEDDFEFDFQDLKNGKGVDSPSFKYPKPTNQTGMKDKSDDFIKSIKLMHNKITNEEVKSLRDLWKWLKNMGYSYSCLKKWKKKAGKAIEPLGYMGVQKLKEIVSEACGYIE